MAGERINIVVTERGSRVVKRRLSGIGTTASASAQGVNLLKTALGAIGGALVLRQLLRTADAFTLIQNRLRLVTGGTEDLANVTKRLLDISSRTRSAFQENAELFNRVALATKELGIEQSQLLDFTESLNKAVILSGASSTEAAAGLIQLSQGLASGALRGDELRSVLEQLPVVADVIAKELNVTRGELRKMGQDGAITAEIIMRAFAGAKEELDVRFKQTIATLGQAWTVLSNQITFFVGRLNESTGVTTAITKLFGWMAENVETLAKVIGAAGLTAAIFLATAAMNAFTAAIAANPIGALVLALTYAISLLVMFKDSIKISKDSIITLGDFATATWERMRTGAATMIDLLRTALPGLSDAWTAMFGDLDISIEGFVKGAARVFDWYIGSWRGVINVIVELYRGLGPALLDLTIQAMNGIIGVIENGLNKIGRAIGSLGQKLPGKLGDMFEGMGESELLPRIDNVAEGAASGLGQAIIKGYNKGLEDTTLFEDSVNQIFDRAEEIAQQRIAESITQDADGPTAPAGAGAPTAQGQSRALQLINKDIREQIELLRMSAAVREVETQVRKKGIALIPAEQEAYRNELQRLQLIKQVSGALDQVRGTEVNLTAAQAELNAQVEAGNITLEQSVEAYRLLQNQALETQTTVAAGWQRGLNQIGDTIKDLASQTETTLVNAFNSAKDALVDFVKTGKVDFKGMVDSILGDLTRLIARMLLVKALEHMGGGPGGGGTTGALANAFGGGKADGGDVEPGKFYMTGEKGPELFAPSVPGRIIPNDKVAKAVGAEDGGGGNGDVIIINVSSREEALAAISSTEGKRIIVNVMGEKERQVV